MKRHLGNNLLPRLAIVIATVLAHVAMADPYKDTQSVLNPAGANASDVSVLWWRTFWMLTVVYVIVLAIVAVPIWRARGRPMPREYIPSEPGREKRLGIFVGSAVGVTTIILFVLLFGDFVVGNKNRALGEQPADVTIKVTGHQWWWEITYEDPLPANTFTDANEIHIPVNQNVRINLESHDVIHSFWAPNLAGKRDLVPGHPTTMYLRANRIGTFWGQCAEYCGYQHAHMRFAVIVQTPDEYAAWLTAAKQPARDPITPIQKRGMDVFMGRTCSSCHTIIGTHAGGRLGPDLTHIASRATIAAGSLPNSMGQLGGWIADPQSIKPGVIMPQHTLSGDDMQALLEYLENLK